MICINLMCFAFTYLNLRVKNTIMISIVSTEIENLFKRKKQSKGKNLFIVVFWSVKVFKCLRLKIVILFI